MLPRFTLSDKRSDNLNFPSSLWRNKWGNRFMKHKLKAISYQLTRTFIRFIEKNIFLSSTGYKYLLGCIIIFWVITQNIRPRSPVLLYAGLAEHCISLMAVFGSNHEKLHLHSHKLYYNCTRTAHSVPWIFICVCLFLDLLFQVKQNDCKITQFRHT